MVTATVNEPDLVRFVEFIVDGIPVSLDHEEPFEYNWPSETGEHQLKAIARPLYASPVLSYEDEIILNDLQPCNAIHSADTDCSGAIEFDELLIVIDDWLKGDIEAEELFEVIPLWKT